MRKTVKAIYISFILGIVLLSVPIKTFAIPGINTAIFQIDFSQFNLPEGDWQLSLVSIRSYKTDLKQAKDFFDDLKSAYLDVKNLCGVPDYIQVESDLSQDEIEAYSEKEIINSSTPITSLYVIIDNEKYSNCHIPRGYGSYNLDPKTILEDKYKATINFWIYHYDKGFQLKDIREDRKDIKINYPVRCEIENNICNLRITGDDLFDNQSLGPYFVVLEKMNSKDEIYFSEPVNINWEASGEIEWKISEVNTYPLHIEKLELNDSNILLIEFENSKSFHYYWIAGSSIVILLIFFLVFFVLKKR